MLGVLHVRLRDTTTPRTSKFFLSPSSSKNYDMKTSLTNIIEKLLAVRPVAERDQEEESRFLQYSAILVVSQAVFLLFGIYNFNAGRSTLALLLAVSSISLLCGWWLLYKNVLKVAVYRANCLLFCGLNIYLMYIGQAEHSMVFWMFISPLVIFFFMGPREGACWTGLLWVSSAAIFIIVHGDGGYDLMFMIRFMVTFSLIVVITYTYEYFRYTHRREILGQNRKLEEEIAIRKSVEASLRESETRYKAIYHQAVEGILLVSSKGVIVDCNPQMLQMLGYGRDQLLGRSVFSVFHPENLKKIPSQLDRLIEGEAILIERQLRTVSGMYIYCEQSGRMIGEDLIILLYRDITERKIAEMALEKANQALEKLANMDGLTGVANRRRFDNVLKREWDRMTREGKYLGLVICDIDYFKQFNDIYGHQVGDDCLIRVANILKNGVHRPADIVARYGGEEFVVLMPDTDSRGCCKIAERLCERVEELGLGHSGSMVSRSVTISCGYSAMIPDSTEKLNHLVAQADKALYTAKEMGRNRIWGELSEKVQQEPFSQREG